MKGVRGVLTLVLVLGGLGYWAYSQKGVSAFNGYILKARPWLVKNDACLDKFVAWVGAHAALDPAAEDEVATSLAALPPIVDEYRGVVQGLHSVPTSDGEIQPLKAQLDLYGSKRLEYLEQYVVWISAPDGEEHPEPPESLITESDQALAQFTTLKAAYFSKYNLKEE